MVICYVLLRRVLDFEPGARYAYSNFGYCILGRVIERVSGRPYEEFVKETLLAPIGITRMRIAHSRPEGRAPGEVAYTDYRDAPLAPSVFERFRSVARPAGGFHLEAMDSHGGWLASASDLVRFVSHVGGVRKPALLSPVLAMEMLQQPPFTSARDAAFYGLGWNVRRLGSGRLNFWHRGRDVTHWPPHDLF